MLYKITNSRDNTAEFFFKTRYEAENKLEELISNSLRSLEFGQPTEYELSNYIKFEDLLGEYSLTIDMVSTAMDASLTTTTVSEKYYFPYLYPERNVLNAYSAPEILQVKYLPQINKIQVFSLVNTLTDSKQDKIFILAKSTEIIPASIVVYPVYTFQMNGENYKTYLVIAG